jgi:hypothetical protein
MHSVALGVLDDARGRQRRRLSIVAVLAICAGIAFGLIVSRSGNPWTTRTPSLRVPSRVAPAAVFSQAPDMGVACHSGSCNSVGLAVWLRRPAVSVSATIAGHPFDLTTGQARPFAPQTPRKMFVGYLTPLQLVTGMRLVNGPPSTWPTANSPHPLLSLRITYRGGRVVMTRLRVPVQPGWG